MFFELLHGCILVLAIDGPVLGQIEAKAYNLHIGYGGLSLHDPINSRIIGCIMPRISMIHIFRHIFIWLKTILFTDSIKIFAQFLLHEIIEDINGNCSVMRICFGNEGKIPIWTILPPLSAIEPSLVCLSGQMGAKECYDIYVMSHARYQHGHYAGRETDSTFPHEICISSIDEAQWHDLSEGQEGADGEEYIIWEQEGA